MENSVKDVSLEEMFQALYHINSMNQNFMALIPNTIMLKCGEVSHEDKKFMEIVKRGTFKKDDH